MAIFGAMLRMVSAFEQQLRMSQIA